MKNKHWTMKIIKIIVLISVTLYLSSCSYPLLDKTKDSYNPAEPGADDYSFAEETGLEVLRCLDENDVEGFKTLLSEATMSKPNAEKQIEMLFDFYEGISTSHDEVRSGKSSAKFREDHYEYKSIYIYIHNIMTDEGKSYNLEFYYVLVDSDDPSKIGISEIVFRDDNGDFALRIFANDGRNVFPKN